MNSNQHLFSYDLFYQDGDDFLSRAFELPQSAPLPSPPAGTKSESNSKKPQTYVVIFRDEHSQKNAMNKKYDSRTGPPIESVSSLPLILAEVVTFASDADMNEWVSNNEGIEQVCEDADISSGELHDTNG